MGAHGIMVVYDITNLDSFKNVKRWLVEIDKYARENVNKLLVGNKKDLASPDENNPNDLRQVSLAQGQDLANSLGVQFVEASAKNGTFVDTAFLLMAHEIKWTLPKRRRRAAAAESSRRAPCPPASFR